MGTWRWGGAAAAAGLLLVAQGAMAEGNGPVVVSATGGYQFVIPPDVFGAEIGNRYAINARKHEDGTVIGIFEYKQDVEEETFRIHVSVTCLQVYDDGTRAKIGGLVEISTFPNRPAGLYAWFQVRDKGEGGEDLADWSTLIGFGDQAANEAFCNSPALPRFGPWNVVGNVQINP